MKKLKKAQILLPPVALAAVLGMSGIASASQTEYVQTKVPVTNAAELAPGDNGDDDGYDDGGYGGGYEHNGGYGGGYEHNGGYGGGYEHNGGYGGGGNG